MNLQTDALKPLSTSAFAVHNTSLPSSQTSLCLSIASDVYTLFIVGGATHFTWQCIIHTQQMTSESFSPFRGRHSESDSSI